MSSILWILAIALGCVFIPHIIYFVYSIFKDPEAPKLIKRGADSVLQRSLGYLSGRKKEKMSNGEEEEDRIPNNKYD